MIGALVSCFHVTTTGDTEHYVMNMVDYREFLTVRESVVQYIIAGTVKSGHVRAMCFYPFKGATARPLDAGSSDCPTDVVQGYSHGR
jgi:hypothetical protein